VLDPSSKATLIVPVCPVESRLAPLAIHRSSKVVIEVTGERAALVCVDGEQEANLSAGDKIVISRSEVPARFFEWEDFHRKLKERL
jgi:NAD kinase